jgi:hypothetical protein
MNSTIVREIRGAKINPKSSFKIRVRKIRGGGNYSSKYGILMIHGQQISDLKGIFLLPDGKVERTEISL